MGPAQLFCWTDKFDVTYVHIFFCFCLDDAQTTTSINIKLLTVQKRKSTRRQEQKDRNICNLTFNMAPSESSQNYLMKRL